MSDIHISSHHAMSTWWQVQIAGEDTAYAEQAAQAAFQITDQLEALLSRFRPDSEISMIAQLKPGQTLRLSEPVFACLRLAREIEALTGGAFNLAVGHCPEWELVPETHAVRMGTAPCLLDLGAIGKGFALDRMAEELADWGVERFMLLSSASSILAGESPKNALGWPIRIGGTEHHLRKAAIGTSGTAIKGNHILDPATALPAAKYERTWALAPSAAEADALSTAFMNMEWAAIQSLCNARPSIGAMAQNNQVLSSGLLKQGTAPAAATAQPA